MRGLLALAPWLLTACAAVPFQDAQDPEEPALERPGSEVPS